MGFNAQEDTFIEINNRTQNHGKDSMLSVSWNRTRTLVQFSDLQTFHSDAIVGGRPVVQEAILRFPLVQKVNGEFSISLHKLQQVFKEREATWECSSIDASGCCNQWRMSQLGSQVNSPFENTPLSVQLVNSSNERKNLDFDVTAAVQQSLDAKDEKIGFLVKNACEDIEGSLRFWSCEASECPQLLLHVHFFCPQKVTTPQLPQDCKQKERNLQWNWDH